MKEILKDKKPRQIRGLMWENRSRFQEFTSANLSDLNPAERQVARELCSDATAAINHAINAVITQRRAEHDLAEYEQKAARIQSLPDEHPAKILFNELLDAAKNS